MTAGLVAAMLGAKVMFAAALEDVVKILFRPMLNIAFIEIGFGIGTFMSSFMSSFMSTNFSWTFLQLKGHSKGHSIFVENPFGWCLRSVNEILKPTFSTMFVCRTLSEI